MILLEVDKDKDTEVKLRFSFMILLCAEMLILFFCRRGLKSTFS